MCTAATYRTRHFYFGRTLDYDFSYREEVTVCPRNFSFPFRAESLKTHYAMIGMAFTPKDFPLFYDAVNEKGLGMAGLNFVGNAVYAKTEQSGKINLAQFEFIPYILGKCATADEAEELIKNIALTSRGYGELPVAELHWIVADKHRAITVEYVKEGLKIYENPVGILTNNPPFDKQLFRLNDYRGLSPKEPKNGFAKELDLQVYSRGLGALGLPGDVSSSSRFVRAAFVKMNSVSGDSEEEGVNQFFHILGAVEQQRGVCLVGEGEYEITIYTSCCDADTGIYYYTTYQNHGISAIDMHAENLDGAALKRYPLVKKESVCFQNR